MNEARRARIKEAQKHLAEAIVIINNVIEEEQTAFDNLPESLQSGEQGTKMEDAINVLTEASNNCDDIDSELSEL